MTNSWKRENQPVDSAAFDTMEFKPLSVAERQHINRQLLEQGSRKA